MVDSHANSTVARSVGRPRLPRIEVMRRVLACLDSSERSQVRLSDLYAVSGVSARCLRGIFLDAFGLTPSSYLRLRRLHRLHAALVMADARLHTVAGLCRHFQFTDAGRVARDYHALFGEYPAQTLAERSCHVPGVFPRPLRPGIQPRLQSK